MQTDTLIIGGGLSGLALAHRLHKANRDFQLIEARDRFGGRILSQEVSYAGSSARFDLGPAWFWPGQPLIAELATELGLKAFYQYSQGALCYQDERGEVHRGQGHASMEGSYRMVGGLQALIDALVTGLPADQHALGTKALRIEQTASGFRTETICGSSAETIESKTVIITLPPRLIAESLKLPPSVPETALDAMRAIPIWMAGHAKIMAIYERPFWREAGLSGDAMSRFGPMMEIHDASPHMGAPYALFGFVGVPADKRRDTDALKQAAKSQLVRLFGTDAGAPLDFILQDWAFEPETATELDLSLQYNHPQYGLPPSLQSLCGGKLMLGSTETSAQSGGYLEGALEAAKRIAEHLMIQAPAHATVPQDS